MRQLYKQNGPKAPVMHGILHLRLTASGSLASKTDRMTNSVCPEGVSSFDVLSGASHKRVNTKVTLNEKL